MVSRQVMEIKIEENIYHAYGRTLTETKTQQRWTMQRDAEIRITSSTIKVMDLESFD